MNRHFKTAGIIIRKIDFGEANRIITVLTDDRGKIDCIAKGARRFKSRFCGRLELFYHVELICFQGRELALIDEVNVMEYFPEIRDVNKHYILFYIAELTNKLIQSGQHIEGIHSLLSKTIKCIFYSQKPDIILHSYLIKLLTLSGFLSPWNKCAMCNEALNPKNPVYINSVNANVACHNCASSADKIIDITLLKWINFMQNYPFSDTLRVKVEGKDHKTVWLWLQGILGNLFSAPIKSEEFLSNC